MWSLSTYALYWTRPSSCDDVRRPSARTMRWSEAQVPDEGVPLVPGRAEQDRARLLRTTQNGAQFKTYESFISKILHLMFLDAGWLQVTENREIETVGKEKEGVMQTLRTFCSIFL